MMDRFYWVALIYVLYLAPFQMVDPEILPYKKDFDSMAARYCEPPKFNKYAITFVPEMTGNTVGVCYKGLTNHSFVIDINKEYWDILDEKQKRNLIFHELTHCYFDVDHSDKKYHYMYYQGVDVVNLEEQTENALIDICKLGKKTL